MGFSTSKHTKFLVLLPELILADTDFLPPVWFLSSRAKGPRGGCYVRSGGSSMTASFGPFTTDTCVLTGKVSGPPSDFCPTVTETLSRSCHNRDMKITGAVMMNFTVFFQKKSVKFIITAPVIFVTRMSRFCHNRDMKMTGAKTKNLCVFRKNQ